MDKEYLHAIKEPMKVHFRMMRLMDSVYSKELMDLNLMEIGRIQWRMVKANIHGKMEVNMKEIIKKIKEKDLESWSILKIKNIKGIGKVVWKMVLDSFTIIHKNWQETGLKVNTKVNDTMVISYNYY